MAAHVGHGVQRLATDAALQGMRRFPRRVEDLDAAVMSRILGRRVSSASVLDGTSGTSSRARLALAGDNVPESVFVKLPAAAAGTRMLGELARLGETEARFYKQLAPELGDGIPRCHGSEFDPLTRPLRHRAGGHDDVTMRIPRHTASSRQRQDGTARRGARSRPRDVLRPASSKARRRRAIRLACGRPRQIRAPR
jgi:hypothetical protein